MTDALLGLPRYNDQAARADVLTALKAGQEHLNLVAAQIVGRPQMLRAAAYECKKLAYDTGSQNYQIETLAEESKSYWAGGAGDGFRTATEPVRKQLWDVTQPALIEIASCLDHAADKLEEATRQLKDIMGRYEVATSNYQKDAKNLTGGALDTLVVDAKNKIRWYWIPKGDEVRSFVAGALAEVASRFGAIARQVRAGESLLDDVARAGRDRGLSVGDTIRRALNGDATQTEFQAAVAEVNAALARIQRARTDGQEPSPSDLDLVSAVFDGMTRDDMTRFFAYVKALPQPINDSISATWGNAIVELYQSGRAPRAINDILQHPTQTMHISEYAYPMEIPTDAFLGTVRLINSSTVAVPPEELGREVVASAERFLTQMEGTSWVRDEAVARALEFATRNDAVATSMLREPLSFLRAAKLMPPEHVAPIVNNLFEPVLNPSVSNVGGPDETAKKYYARELLLTFLDKATKPETDSDGNRSSISALLPLVRDPHTNLSRSLAQALGQHIEVLDHQGEIVTQPADGRLKYGTYHLAVGFASYHGGDVLLEAARRHGSDVIATAIREGKNLNEALRSAGDVYGAVHGGAHIAGSLENHVAAAIANGQEVSRFYDERGADLGSLAGIREIGYAATSSIPDPRLKFTLNVANAVAGGVYTGVTGAGPTQQLPEPFIDFRSDSVPTSPDGALRAADDLIEGYKRAHKSLVGGGVAPIEFDDDDRWRLAQSIRGAYSYTADYEKSVPQEVRATKP